MHRLPARAILLLIIISAANHTLSAQAVPGTKWMQRETDDFVIIYPDTMSDEAAALALALDDVLSDAGKRLPVAHDKKKWPLILTNLGLEANGFVTLAPRHSVWYATPGEDFTAASDWLMLLARHEARHMTQFDAADQGTTRVLHILFGELGWGAGIVLGTPSWLLEGDAVVMETVLSEEGRGRDPLFTQEVMAIAAENPDSTYYKAVNPSYKNHVPDYYKVGYAISSWIREEYGSDSMEEIYRSSARIPLPVIGINTGVKRTTDQLPKEIYGEMIADLALSAAAVQEAGDWTEADVISPEQDSFARYDALFESSQGHIYGRKETMAQAPRLVRVDTDNSIMRLPSGGRVSLAETTDERGEPRIRVAWNSLRRHPVFLGSSVSDITIVDLNSKDQVVRRKIVVSGSRYLYPALSPDGSKIAVVEILGNGSSALVILDAENGEAEKRIDLSVLPGPATAAYPSWSPDSQKLVFSLRNDGGRRISQWDIGSELINHLTESSFSTIKTPVYSADGEGVFYSSNESGLEAIWYLDISDIEAPHPPHRPQAAARRWYGAARPAVSADGNRLYLVEYASSNGEVVSRVNYGQLESSADQALATIIESIPESIPDPIPASIIIEENPQAIARDAEIRDPENREQMTAKGNLEYPESDYRPGRHAFNVHSWGFYLGPSPGSFSVNELLLNVQSRDVLGTMTFEAGALYETSESSPGAYIDLSFTGIRPVISIKGEYRYRSPKSDPFHQTTFALSALYPMNLARTGIWNHQLDLGVTAGLLSYYPSASNTGSNNPGANYPYLSYAANWQRLRPGSDRAIRPDLGWRLRTIYSQIPLPGEYGDSASAELDLYFPGGFRNSSLSLGGGIEFRTANFSPVISQPRGYEWENPDSTIVASVDYEFPLGYPDLPLASVIFIQRFRLGLFSDFGFINSDFERRWSTGATLTMDFAAFNNFSGLSIGLQFSWLWEEAAPQFTFMLMDLPM